MLRIILTILLVGAFFILFFKPNYNLKNKTDLGSVATDTGTGRFQQRMVSSKIHTGVPFFLGEMEFPQDMVT